MDQTWGVLPAEVIQRIASQLDGMATANDVAVGLRLVSKTICAALRGPGCVTVHLSQPVPPEVFAQHWTRPDALHRLTMDQQRQLLRLTASSGVVANLEVAARVTGLQLEHSMVCAAARAGQLPTCEWLRKKGLAWDGQVLEAAVGGGHLELCRTLRAAGCSLPVRALHTAAERGNPQLVEWLLAEGAGWCAGAAEAAALKGSGQVLRLLMRLHEDDPAGRPIALLHQLRKSAAWGCGLDDFRAVHEWCAARGEPLVLGPGDERGDAGEPRDRRPRVLLAAVFGPTREWEAKASWLLDEQGYPTSLELPAPASHEYVFEAAELTNVMVAVLPPPDAPQRVAWMRRRGLLSPSVLRELLSQAAAGSAQAVADLLDAGAVPTPEPARIAALAGRIDVLRLLHARGCPLAADGECYEVFRLAALAGCGRVAVLDWLQRTYFPQGFPAGDGSPLARQGLVEALALAAADRGSVEALDWLERAVFRGVLPPPGTPPLTFGAFMRAAQRHQVQVMRWLLQRSCPCDLSSEAELRTALARTSGEGVELLAEHGRLPMGRNDGLPYLVAGAAGNLPVMAALRRAGVPWSPETFTEAARRRLPLRLLRWMLAEEVPLDLPAAAAAAGYSEAAYQTLLRRLDPDQPRAQRLQQGEEEAGGQAGA